MESNNTPSLPDNVAILPDPYSRAMEFDSLEPIIIPVSIKVKGKSGGEETRRYFLHEGSEDVACKYQNAATRAARFTDNKVTSYEGIADIEPYLVSLCLYRADDNGQFPYDRDGRPDPRKLIPLQTIRTWKPKIVRSLFDKAKEISNLDSGTKTVADIDKEILSLQEQRARLLAQQDDGGEDSAAKKQRGPTSSTIDRPESPGSSSTK